MPAMEALARSLAELREQAQILDHINESVIVMDLGGYITRWNRGAERMFGYAAAEAVGRNVLFLYADEDAAGDAETLGGFLETNSREMDVRRRRKSGEVFWASLQLSVIRDEAGQPTGLVGYLSDITERKRAEERIHHLAYYDSLTGLPNRALLYKLVDQALAAARRNRLHGALLFIDLNRFKPINDTLGHGVGDLLLQQVAARLHGALRGEDVVARLGGDEFVIALFDIARREHAGTVAEKVRELLDEPFHIHNQEFRVGAAIGISVFPEDGDNTDDLLRLADIAMYRAKQTGDGHAFYNHEMNRRALDRLRIEAGLRHALAAGELFLQYQPKVEIASGRIVGAEALVRWRRSGNDVVPPGDFIPVAEESGLVVRIGAWVLDAACAQASAWRAQGLPPLKIAVNLSAREFAPALSQRVQEVLNRYGLPPSWLELEITESMLTHSTDGVIRMMGELAGLGIALSLDDFGTGFSSLSYLKRFPIDALKIDRSFVTGIPDDANDCAIAGAILSMARQLNLRVVAEGVETPAQLEFLKARGCDDVQGYIFAAPVDAGTFARMLCEDRRLMGMV